MIEIEALDVGYGKIEVLRNVELNLHEGELITVIGSNGAGKTTLLRAISGILKPNKGEIRFNGELINNLAPHKIVSKGIVQVPEARVLFPSLTVAENLRMGGYLINEKELLNNRFDLVFNLFPRLKERYNQLAGTLSGGEQQMCAIGRGLMANPKLLMLDEPSLGLAPKIVEQLCEIILRINKEHSVSILLVEQNVQISCEMCSRAFVLENGRIVLEGTGQEMLNNDHVRRAYLGL